MILGGRLAIFSPSGPDFINPVDRVKIPGISLNPLTLPFAETIRNAFDGEFDGRFREIIENGIRDLGLENQTSNLPATPRENE